MERGERRDGLRAWLATHVPGAAAWANGPSRAHRRLDPHRLPVALRTHLLGDHGTLSLVANTVLVEHGTHCAFIASTRTHWRSWLRTHFSPSPMNSLLFTCQSLTREQKVGTMVDLDLSIIVSSATIKPMQIIHIDFSAEVSLTSLGRRPPPLLFSRAVSSAILRDAAHGSRRAGRAALPFLHGTGTHNDSRTSDLDCVSRIPCEEPCVASLVSNRFT